MILSDDDSDDIEFNDGEAAYKAFKTRKGRKRKRATASSRRARAAEHHDTIVGRRPKKDENPPARKRQMREYDDVSSDDELMEYTLPDYLQKRRAQFDKRMELLKQAGLKLPPILTTLNSRMTNASSF